MKIFYQMKFTKKILMWMMLTGLTIVSCKKLDKLTQFDITYHNHVTIPAAIPVNTPYDILTPEIETNTEEEFENNNTHKDLIEEIKLKALTLTILDPTDEDFDFLNAIEIYIETDDLPEKKIAWKDNIPESGLQQLELETSGDDLKEYLLEDSFKLKIKTTTDHATTRDITIDVKTVFHVNAKILGV